MHTCFCSRRILGLLVLVGFISLSAVVMAEPVEFTWKAKDADIPGSGSYGQPYGVLQYTVEPGQGTLALPNAVIVLAANPTRSAQVAAAELNHYVEKITGMKLRVLTEARNPVRGGKILIGESSLTRSLGLHNADFEDQEYLIRSYGDVLVLMGRDEEEYGPIDYEGDGLWPGFTRFYDWSLRPSFATRLGSVYAVDTFLQKHAGVRWYMPGDLGEVCPQQKTLAVKDLNLREKPWTYHRSIGPYTPTEYFNFLGSGRPVERMNSRDVNLWLLRMKYIGSEAFACNHSLIYDWFKKRFPDKPEILAQGYEKPTQLCLTSPELLKIVVQDADDYFNGRTNYERGSGDYFPVMPHDTSDYCQCAACQALLAKGQDPADTGWWSGRASVYTWSFVNAVAREVKKTHPDKWVSCCAYARYFKVPPGVQFSDNVAVETCRVLIAALRDPAYMELSRQEMEKWSKTVKRWYVWEYFDHLQGNGMECNFPGVFLRAIAEDIQFLKANGCRGMFNEQNSGGGFIPNFAQDHLNVYAQAQLLCDASVDVDVLRHEYCKLFYGPAAEPMHEFYMLMEQRFTDPKNWELGPEDTDANWDRVCPPGVLNQFGALLDQAGALAKEDPYYTRVRLIKEAVYGMMVKNGMKHFVMMNTTKRKLIAAPVTDPANIPQTEENHVAGFFAINGDPTNTRTEAWVGYDAQNLYLKVKCYEPEPESIRAEVKTNDQVALCEDDTIEVFIDPGRTRETYYQVLGNTRGAISDQQVIVGGGGAGFAYQSGVTTKVEMGPEAWIMLFTIPLKNLTGGQAVKKGDLWGLNICRDRWRKGESRSEVWTAWCPTGSGFHVPAKFGVLEFG